MAGFLTAVFVSYLIFVISISLSTSYQTFLISIIGLSIMAMVACAVLRKKKTDNVCCFVNNNINIQHSAPRFMPVMYFFIVLIFSVIYWLGDFPGGFNLDAYGQWLQAHNLMQYNDWHPFVSTLLIKLILGIFDSFYFYIALQIVFFSSAVSYLLYSLQCNGVNHRILIDVAFYIGLNPAIGLNTINMTKDVQFTILITFLTGVIIRIISTDGKWLKNIIHVAILSVLIVMTALIRHNGILFIFPIFTLLTVIFKSVRSKMVISFIFVIMLLIFIKWPVANTLNVQKHDNALGEAVGIPMGMMANALVTDEENLSSDVHAFLNTIADDNEWKDHYITGEWDSCKWDFGGIELLRDYTISDLLHYTAVSIIHCPQACYEAFRENTRMVWSPTMMLSSWIPNIYIEENEFNIQYLPISLFHEISGFFLFFSEIPLFSCLFWNFGFHFLMLLIVWLMQNKTLKERSALLVFPIFVYAVGTMLLLSGPNQRYYYFGLVLIIPTILFLLCNGRKEKGE